MLTNDDLRVLSKSIDYLSMLHGNKAIECCNELIEIYNKVVDNKNELSRRANKYNKANRKIHNLQNKLYYNRKRKNWTKVDLIEKELETLKKLSQK